MLGSGWGPTKTPRGAAAECLLAGHLLLSACCGKAETPPGCPISPSILEKSLWGRKAGTFVGPALCPAAFMTRYLPSCSRPGSIPACPSPDPPAAPPNPCRPSLPSLPLHAPPGCSQQPPPPRRSSTPRGDSIEGTWPTLRSKVGYFKGWRFYCPLPGNIRFLGSREDRQQPARRQR